MSQLLPLRVLLMHALCLVIGAGCLLVVHFACGPLSGHVPHEKTFYAGGPNDRGR